MKTAAEQADEALKNGTITQEQYDGLQREIAETEAKLKSLEEQANQSATDLQSIAAKGEKLKTVGENISNVGTKLLPVTGAVVGPGTAAVKVAADSGHFADILAAASSNANTNVSMMGETFKYCAPMERSLDQLTREMTEAFVEKVIVWPGQKLEIKWKIRK